MTVTEVLQRSKLSLSQAAQRAGVPYSTMHGWVINGVRGRKLKSFRVGARIFVFEADLTEFLEAGFAELTAEAPSAE